MYPPDKDSASRGRSYLALGEARVFGRFCCNKDRG
jgi:hypothetical protein